MIAISIGIPAEALHNEEKDEGTKRPLIFLFTLDTQHRILIGNAP